MATDKNVSGDLTWIDVLKGMAIIGVVFDHWVPFWRPAVPSGFYSVLRLVPWGSSVQVFFVLSGFGLTLAYQNKQDSWSWRSWIWRRITKIVIPYWIAVLFSIALGELGSKMYGSVNVRSPWTSFLALFTFTRSLFPESWSWNYPLWYMPVIIGLYVCFPLMIAILNKRGARFLLISSAFLCYGSIVLSAGISGRFRSHDEAWFPFFIVQFALGMILVLIRERNPHSLELLIGFRGLLLGTGLCLASWGVLKYLPHGDSYNDLLTATGVPLVFMNVFSMVRTGTPVLTRVLHSLGRKSYFIFLLHYPVLAFVLGPIIKRIRNSIQPAIIPVLGLLFLSAIYLLCCVIEKPVGRLTAWLYEKGPQNNRSALLNRAMDSR